MFGPKRNAAELPGFVPEDFYVEGRAMHKENIPAAVYEAEERRLAESFRRIDREIKASTILMATVGTLMVIEYVASGSSVADWYAPALRKMSSFAEDNLDFSMKGTLLLNGIMQVVDRIRLKKITNKLWDLIQKIENIHE